LCWFAKRSTQDSGKGPALFHRVFQPSLATMGART